MDSIVNRKSKIVNPIDYLLLCVPACLAIRFIPGLHNPTALFIVSCLAIVPLAGWLGHATEHLSEHVGAGLGGLLNATFGNAAELIIALMAMSRGLTEVVKASITGSIIGNILLVLGAAMLAGGIKHPEQYFNRTAARSSSSSLTMAAIALIIPAVFRRFVKLQSDAWMAVTEQKLSLAIAVVLIVTYVLSLYFSLKTHRELYLGCGDEVSKAEDDKPSWSKAKSIVILLTATLFVALISEFLVDSIEAARHTLGLTQVFVGIIVVAIIGNAAEHTSAVMMAMKNKMDLALGIANGSSLQVALFVAPVLVFASYLFGKPMDLEFTIPEIMAIVVSVILVQQISGDGESNWLEGVQLLAVYIILAILFFFVPEVAR